MTLTRAEFISDEYKRAVRHYMRRIRCACGAVNDETDPADLRVVSVRWADGTKGVKIVRCPMCPTDGGT